MTSYYCLSDLKAAFSQKRRLHFLFFWGGDTPGVDINQNCLSQWFVANFTVDGVCYPTAEHWMMAQKALLFQDHQTHQKVIEADHPSVAKQLGREVSGFDEKIWKTHRERIVQEGNFHKFSQNALLKDYLLQTNDKILVEASPVDKIWGVGLVEEDPRIVNPLLWKGQNLMGFAIMRVRAQLLG
ncbi:NADAR family protein [Neisseria sp. Ec49-e6-T10]|uniref:NADAR family protein n=1 Tax=Neisseria sp. Ec49-e6-T10 TaxID=3140744 RepID=UPI003EC14D9B